MSSHNETIRVKIIINIILVNLNWYLLLKLSSPWQAIAWLSLGLLLYLTLKWANRPRTDQAFILMATVWGCCIEYMFIHTSTLVYAIPRSLPPLFMIALWINFACSFPWGLRWLLNIPKVGFLIGLIAGPLTYYGGSSISSELTPNQEIKSLAILSITWAISIYLLTHLYKHLNKKGSNHVPA